MNFVKKLTESEKIKRLTNRKIVLGAFAILFAVAFIAVSSFISFTFTKERLTSAKFWTDELIIIAITIFSMMATLFIGSASNAQNPNSKIAHAKVVFVEYIAKIVNINAFYQWVKKVLQPRDIQAIKERELRKIGIDDYSVLTLEDAEVIALSEKAQKYNGRYYSKITPEQANKILDLKDGVKRINLVEPLYYLTVSSIDADRTISEKSGREQKVKTAKLSFSVFTKIMITLIPAMFFAALARDLLTQQDTAQAWATFIARMFALISSAFYGYIVGCQINDIDADFIEMRSNTMRLYLQDGDFKPLDQQELAKQEFVERVKEDNKEYTIALGFNDSILPLNELVEKNENETEPERQIEK